MFPWAIERVEKQASKQLMNPKEDFSLPRSEIIVAPVNANKYFIKDVYCIIVDSQLCSKKGCSRDPPVSAECHLAMLAYVGPFSPDILPR